jgi:protocatechuate 3,4-dioxygenase beta subunit
VRFLLAFVVGLGLGCGAWLMRPTDGVTPSDGPGSGPEAATPAAPPEPPAPELRSSRRPPGARGVTDLALLAGTVVDAQGLAVAGAVLDIPGPDHPGAVRSDAKGRFSLPLRGARGPLTVRVRAAGFVERLVEGLEAAATNVQIVLEPGFAIRGRVVDPEGRLVAGATVTIGEAQRPITPTRAAPGAPIDTSRFDARDLHVTGPDGRFLLEDLPGTSHRLFATAPRFARSRGVSAAAPSTDVVLELQPGYALEVHVRDLRPPVAGAWVTSEEQDPPYPPWRA